MLSSPLQSTKPAKLNPAKASPAKPNPAKASPAKPSPAKPNPAKPSPAKPKPAYPSPGLGSFVVGIMEFLPPPTSICYGCHRKLKDRNGNLPSPPNNLVIVTCCSKRKYWDKKTQQERSKSCANIYFHLNKNCVKRFSENFVPSQVEVPDDLKPHLRQEHISLLEELKQD